MNFFNNPYIKLVSVWIGILLIIGGLFEIYFQVSDSRRHTALVDEGRIEHTFNENFGIWRIPNQKNKVQKAECFYVNDNNINSLGMRAEELNPRKKRKVGYFGDSMIQASDVSRNDHFIYKLNAYDTLRDHLNFGMAATGTTYQYFNFLHFSEIVHFDEVVLCVYLGNDLWNNSYKISVMNNWEPDMVRPYFLWNTKTQAYDVDMRKVEDKVKWYGASKVIGRLIEINEKIQIKLKTRKNPSTYICKAKNKEIPFNVQRYCSLCHNPDWEEAKKITEYSILQFKKACKDKNIDFKVVLILSGTEFSTKDEIKRELPDVYEFIDYTKENKYFENFLQSENINYLNLLQPAKDYTSKHQLPISSIKYDCDIHYNPIGHKMLFETLRDKWFNL